MAPTVSLAESAGAVIDYRTFEGFEHDPAYLPQLEDSFIDFLASTERERFPDGIVWEAGEPSGCDWLMVDSVISWPLIGEDLEFNSLLISDRLQFGFYPDWEFEGDGILVSGVVDGDVPAARLEFQEGDVIVGFTGEEITSLDDIGILQEEMTAGDSFSITIQRGSEILSLRDRFNPPMFYWLLPRSGPSVRIEAEYSLNRFDLSINRFCRIRLLLHPDMVDFSREVTVICNGFEVFRGYVEEDGNFAVASLYGNLDFSRAYTAELELDLEDLLLPLMHDEMSN